MEFVSSSKFLLSLIIPYMRWTVTDAAKMLQAENDSHLSYHSRDRKQQILLEIDARVKHDILYGTQRLWKNGIDWRRS